MAYVVDGAENDSLVVVSLGEFLDDALWVAPTGVLDDTFLTCK